MILSQAPATSQNDIQPPNGVCDTLNSQIYRGLPIIQIEKKSTDDPTRLTLSPYNSISLIVIVFGTALNQVSGSTTAKLVPVLSTDKVRHHG
jgi:hypothetical protein